MANPRFYCDAHKLALGAILTLPEGAAIHAAKALRMQAGDRLRLFNGDGHDYTAEITLIKKNEVVVKVDGILEVDNESPIQIELAQGISSGDRMDYTIQKSVEMGVTRIQPIAMQRSVVKLHGDRAEKRVQHWQEIVYSACEQSGRAFVPEVMLPMTLEQWLAQLIARNAPSVRLTLSPYAEHRLHDLGKPAAPVILLIGPEGGLTEQEIHLASTQGFSGVRLGARVLRTETAALAAIAAMQTLWGDF